ncbi:MAG: addiction module component, family protein [Gammaproteobacteria bacterium]|nr:addiction module component, family protein [Gammaproteobacteria bacterium]
MSRSVAELFDEAAELAELERATLAGLLLESLEKEADQDVEAAWEKEISRRINDIESGRVALLPWEDVKARLLGE